MNILGLWVTELSSGFSFEQVNLLPALKRMGHKVSVFPLVNKFINFDRNIGRLSNLDSILLDILKFIKPDLLITLIYHRVIEPITYKYITENTPITTLLICGDDEKYFTENCDSPTKEYSPFFDNVWTTYNPAKKWHEDIGCRNVIYAGYHANEKIYKKKKIDKDTDVAFCGSMNTSRIHVMNKIMMADIKIKVYGNGWRDNPYSSLTTDEYVNLMNRTKVNINISEDEIDGKIYPQIKARDFEVPMAGGFLLTTANPALEEYYKIGKEIEVYTDYDELINKIKFFIKHDSIRERIAQAGHKRALKDHTTTKRLSYVFENLKMKGENG